MTERRSALLFAVVVTALLALLTAQEPERAAGLALRVEGPVKRLVGDGVDRVERGFDSWRSRQKLEEENARLRRQVRDLEADVIASRATEVETDILSARFGYVPPPDVELRLVDVVYVDHRSWRRIAILRLARNNRSESWLRRPVTTLDGLLGRVVSAEGDYARILLVTDPTSSVGAMIERTQRQGIVRGTEDSAVLSLSFVPLQADVRPGDRLVTAGIDGVFPRGIPLGTVTSVAPGDDVFHEIRVAPSADLSTLNHAFIWRLDPLPEAVMDGADAVAR